MNETPASPVQNSVIPPIGAITTPPVINELPKKRNYIPWLLGILVLVIVLSASFVILTSKSKSTPTGSLIKPIAPQEQTTVTATDIDMSSWKTYSNEEYGIRLKFPSAYSYQIKGENYQQKMAQANTPISGNSNPSDNTIVFSEKSPEFNLVIYSKYPSIGDEVQGSVITEKPSIDEKFKPCSESYANRTLEDRVIKINNFYFQKSVQEFNGLTDVRYCTFTGNAYLIGVEIYQLPEKNVKEATQLLEQILSTLKLL